ncbi:MAG: MFS transporter [Bacilli bacterium]
MRILPKAPDLLRETAFRRYWFGQSLSLLGGQISMLAFPLTAVLALHASAEGVALLTALGSLPSLLFSVPAGSWVERRGRRRQTMMMADVGRAFFITCIPFSYFLHILSLPLLMGIWFLSGTCSVFFRVASSTLFSALVPREQYVEANSLMHTSRAVGFLIGPSLGGFLIQALSAPVALLADALSFLMSAASLAAIHPEEPPCAVSPKRDVGAGLRFIRSSPVLSSLLAAEGTMSLFQAVFMAEYILYGTRFLGITPSEWGLLLGPSSVAAIAASALAGRVIRRFGLGPVLIGGMALVTLPYLLVPWAHGPHLLIVVTLFVAEGLVASGSMFRAISSSSIQSAAIPDHLRARVSAGFVMVNTGLRPLGAMLAAALVLVVGVHGTIWVAVIGGSVASLWLMPASVRRLKSLDDLPVHQASPLHL